MIKKRNWNDIEYPDDSKVGLPLDMVEISYLESYNEFLRAYQHMVLHYDWYTSKQVLKMIKLGLSFNLTKIDNLIGRYAFFGIEIYDDNKML